VAKVCVAEGSVATAPGAAGAIVRFMHPDSAAGHLLAN